MRLFIRVAAILGALTLSQVSWAGAEIKPQDVQAKAITDGVIVRQAPDDKSATVATLKKGDAVTASDRKGAYWKVKLSDGKEGFVAVTSLQTTAGVGAVKDAVKGVMPASTGGSGTGAAAPATKAADEAKSKANAKADEAKAKRDAAIKKESDSRGKKLEKAATSLFK